MPRSSTRSSTGWRSGSACIAVARVIVPSGSIVYTIEKRPMRVAENRAAISTTASGSSSCASCSEMSRIVRSRARLSWASSYSTTRCSAWAHASTTAAMYVRSSSLNLRRSRNPNDDDGRGDVLGGVDRHDHEGSVGLAVREVRVANGPILGRLDEEGLAGLDRLGHGQDRVERDGGVTRHHAVAIALVRAGDECAGRGVDGAEPSELRVQNLHAVVHDGSADVVEGGAARQCEGQLSEALQDRGRFLRASRARRSASRSAARRASASRRASMLIETPVAPTIDTRRRRARAHRDLRASARSRRARRPDGRTATAFRSPCPRRRRRGHGRGRRGGAATDRSSNEPSNVPGSRPNSASSFVSQSTALFERSHRHVPISPASRARRRRCASAACGRVRASSASRSSRTSVSKRRADHAERDDDGADDVVFFDEVAVDGAQHDRQPDRQHSEGGDLPGSRAERGDHRTDDQRADQDGVALGHDVGDRHDRDRDQPRQNPAAWRQASPAASFRHTNRTLLQVGPIEPPVPSVRFLVSVGRACPRNDRRPARPAASRATRCRKPTCAARR